VSVAGPQPGSTFQLGEAEVSIGRDRSSELWLDDPSVSRRHCTVKCYEGRFVVFDHGSYNGTRVNGVPVKERVLEHGDMVSIGDSLLLFLRSEEPPPAVETSNVVMDDNCDDEPTILLPIEEAFYLHPEKVLAVLPTTARLARDLNALLRIIAVLSSTTRMELLIARLLESLFEVLPAQRAAIVLRDHATDELQPALGRNRDASAHEVVHISRTILNRVMTERVAMLGRNVSASDEFSDVDSLRAGDIRSLLCVPLVVFNKTLGAIYADITDVELHFDENHLQLLTAIAAIASMSSENVRRLEWLEDENERLRAAVASDFRMVGESPAMRGLYNLISKVAPSDTTVLILGESGTGKEMAAQAIHANSSRRDRAFIAINCAVLSDALIESELFGHEKGAFTGAIAQKKGKIEIAEGGTLFLDEVGELAPGLQAKLLRVLQEREFERVGGTRSIKANVRVIAATNMNLDEAIRSGRFRQDLYYRINVVQLTMPALRERKEDVELLASYFAVRYAEKCKRKIKGISPEARTCLMSYDWPGNVRELENAIERAAVLGATEIIMPDDLP